jgi:hypothetical protein
LRSQPWQVLLPPLRRPARSIATGAAMLMTCASSSIRSPPGTATVMALIVSNEVE